ncbi:hypothetical protein [Microcoleus vaginatus]|uniref:hypothetical protein n=1 Tax=Microcoleus vaginatus TaxID=119532 RepID=UPI001F619A5F|nr:hypothetical protein D0A37_15000 [Microcoleus vaginatus HSN003]
MYLGSDGDRPQFRLLKGSPQRALYFTGRARDQVRAIDKAGAVPNRTMPNTILDFRFEIKS